jgi:parallel beta-helix repeat protein
MKRLLAIGVILLFVGLSISSSGNQLEKQSTIATLNDGSLSGYVNNTLMNPIVGASVRVYFHGTYEEDFTDSSGYYHVTNIPICNCSKNYTAFKYGLKPAWVLLNIFENTTHDFVLTPRNKLYVGGSGPGNYTKIQDAINDSSDGDTVYVYDDSSPYYENVQIIKSINLIGENKETTIIDGNEIGDVLWLMTDEINVSGFTIQNGSNSNGTAGGIRLDASSNSKIFNNIVKNNDKYGIHVIENESSNNLISRNIIMKNGADDYRTRACLNIYLLRSSNNIIADNIIKDAIGIGIGICYWSENTTVSRNIITDNKMEGIKSRFSYNNTIIENTIENNNLFGIRILYGSSSNLFQRNNIQNNFPINVFFILTNPKYPNHWDNNYWGQSRLFPKPIIGYVQADAKKVLGIPWLALDWHPASEPYDIGV